MGSSDVITIDCLYQRPRHAASFLMIEDREAAFVETNTAHAVPLLLDALKGEHIAPEQVRFVIVTHIHFDHAGGVSILLDKCPNAVVVCHPNAVRHLVDPSRLIASAKRVYGDEEFERLYMPMHEIDESRVQSVNDGEQLCFGGRTLTFVHTRGHASHHICIHDSGSGGVFTGDTFGVEYDSERRSERPFLLCSAAPIDFDPNEAMASIDRIRGFEPAMLFLTHYGAVAEVEEADSVLRESIARLVMISRAAAELSLDGKELYEFCATRIRSAVEEHATACGVILSSADRTALESYVDINAQGLAVYVKKCKASMVG